VGAVILPPFAVVKGYEEEDLASLEEA